MGYVWQRWMAREFRAAGLRVIEVDGWQNRGRPASTGHFDPTGPVTVHHTGVTSSAQNPNPTLQTLIKGRSDLPGPLCHFSVRYDGAVVIIAAGRANHAGRVGKSGILGMPLGADGNAIAMGDEVDTNGTQKLPEAQRKSIAITNAVVTKHFGKPVTWLHRHADISSTGKWDIGQMNQFELEKDAAEERAKLDGPKQARTRNITAALTADTRDERLEALNRVIEHGSPAAKEAARAWRTAILQQIAARKAAKAARAELKKLEVK